MMRCLARATALTLIRLGAEAMVLFIGEGSTCRFEDVPWEALKAISERNEAAIRALNAWDREI